MPANAIFQFRFDEATGALTPNDPPKVQPETGEGPPPLRFPPLPGRPLTRSTRTAAPSPPTTSNPDSGRLSSFQVLSTLPHGAPAEGESTAEIAVTPDGRHLYGSNRGHDSLAHFEVAADGRLTARGHTPTEATPRFFDLDPTGRYLYSAGQGSGKVAVFRIDAGSARPGADPDLRRRREPPVGPVRRAGPLLRAQSTGRQRMTWNRVVPMAAFQPESTSA